MKMSLGNRMVVAASAQVGAFVTVNDFIGVERISGRYSRGPCALHTARRAELAKAHRPKAQNARHRAWLSLHGRLHAQLALESSVLLF